VSDQSVHFEFLRSKLFEFILGVNRGTRIDAQIDAEVNQIPFHVLVDGDSAVISFDSFSDALDLCKMFAVFFRKANIKRELNKGKLKNLNITVYLQNRHIGIAGPNANPLTSRFLYMLTYILGKN
jgi:hypothetical protein